MSKAGLVLLLLLEDPVLDARLFCGLMLLCRLVADEAVVGVRTCPGLRDGFGQEVSIWIPGARAEVVVGVGLDLESDRPKRAVGIGGGALR